MANALYTKGKQKFLEGYINLPTDTIMAYLVDTGAYTLNIATHDFYTDIPPAAVIANTTLASVTVTNGIMDATDANFTTVSGANCELLVIAQDTGSAANSALIAAIDTATGLPVTPNGGDITITWDDGANKIFALT